MIHPEPIIRPIRAEEAPEAKALIYTIAHPLARPDLTKEDFVNSWESRGAMADLDDVQKNYFDQDGVFLIAEVCGRMVGTGAIRRYAESPIFAKGGRLHTRDQSLLTGAGVCEVRRINLLPEFRGQKLGYLMMLDLIQRAREMGYTKMILWTNPITLHRAVDFYHQLGFTDLPIDDLDEDELWMGMEI